MGKKLVVKDRERCIGCYSCMYACSRAWHNIIGIEKSAMRVKNYPGVEGAFSVRICQACLEPECAEICPTGALKLSKKGYGVELDQKKCTHCMRCVKACSAGALQWDDETRMPLPCYHCGICVMYCPTNVLDMQEVVTNVQNA
ncbi:4Fe-4S dicluster domain-containing protein [Pseudothermotoga elfii]